MILIFITLLFFVLFVQIFKVLISTDNINQNREKEIEIHKKYIIKHKIKIRYYNWIESHCINFQFNIAQQYKQKVLDMALEFPELIIVQGFVLLGNCYVPHFWLIDMYGEIIDPTVIRFERDKQYLPFFRLNPAEIFV